MTMFDNILSVNLDKLHGRRNFETESRYCNRVGLKYFLHHSRQIQKGDSHRR